MTPFSIFNVKWLSLAMFSAAVRQFVQSKFNGPDDLMEWSNSGFSFAKSAMIANAESVSMFRKAKRNSSLAQSEPYALQIYSALNKIKIILKLFILNSPNG